MNLILAVRETCKQKHWVKHFYEFFDLLCKAQGKQTQRQTQFTSLAINSPYILIGKKNTLSARSHLQLIFLLSAHDPRLALRLGINKKRITRCLGNDDAVLNRELVAR